MEGDDEFNDSQNIRRLLPFVGPLFQKFLVFRNSFGLETSSENNIFGDNDVESPL